MAKKPKLYTHEQVLKLKARLYNAFTKERYEAQQEWFARGLAEGEERVLEKLRDLLQVSKKEE